ncbi:MAG: pyrrolo-quinoline quinone, partial [Vicinamibacterales bacterium]
MNLSRRVTVSLGLVFAAVGSLAADNWPQWRGPLMNGVSQEKSLPLKWSADTGENIAWKLPMPSRSGATPIIWKDHIFLNVATAERDGDIELWAVERNKGVVIWKRPLSSGNLMQRKQNMSTPSPVTDGTAVWAMTGTGVLKSFDFSGTELWTRDLQKDYGRF